MDYVKAGQQDCINGPKAILLNGLDYAYWCCIVTGLRIASEAGMFLLQPYTPRSVHTWIT